MLLFISSVSRERTCLHRLESLCHQFLAFSPFYLFAFSPLVIIGKTCC